MTEAVAFLVGLLMGSGLTAVFLRRARSTPEVLPEAPPEAPPEVVAPVLLPPPVLPVETASGDLLVIDDDPLIRSFLRRGLSRRGLRPILAESGEEAQALLADNPDVRAVLLDLHLMGMSGVEVLAWLHREHPDLQVLMMTGMDHESLHDLEGLSGVLQKPFRIDDVIAQLTSG